MKKLTKTLLALCFASAMAVTTTFGQAYTIAFDENGNISINGNSVGPGVPGLDTLSGMTTLRYDASGLAALGAHWVQGDLLLFELGANGANGAGAPSDIIRFEANAQGQPTAVFFYSDLEPTDVPPFDLADVPILPQPLPVNFLLDELGTEGNNGVNYTPLTPSQPGYVFELPGAVLYKITSDAVPEPNTLAVLGLAGGLLALFGRRQSARV